MRGSAGLDRFDHQTLKAREDQDVVQLLRRVVNNGQPKPVIILKNSNLHVFRRRKYRLVEFCQFPPPFIKIQDKFPLSVDSHGRRVPEAECFRNLRQNYWCEIWMLAGASK